LGAHLGKGLKRASMMASVPVGRMKPCRVLGSLTLTLASEGLVAGLDAAAAALDDDDDLPADAWWPPPPLPLPSMAAVLRPSTVAELPLAAGPEEERPLTGSFLVDLLEPAEPGGPPPLEEEEGRTLEPTVEPLTSVSSPPLAS
jgi:hypothetical protein